MAKLYKTKVEISDNRVKKSVSQGQRVDLEIIDPRGRSTFAVLFFCYKNYVQKVLYTELELTS